MDSYLIVPLFAIATPEFHGGLLTSAFSSPITLGILLGYVISGHRIAGGTFVLTRLTRGRVRPPVGWAGSRRRTIAGVATVSLLVATLASRSPASGSQAQRARRCLHRLGDHVALPGHGVPPRALRVRLLIVLDLCEGRPRTHIAGRSTRLSPSSSTALECPYCGQAEPVLRQLPGPASPTFGTLAACAQRSTRIPARRRGVSGSSQPGGVLGDATCCSITRTRSTWTSDELCAARTRCSVRRGLDARSGAKPRRRRRRQRRPERRHGT